MKSIEFCGRSLSAIRRFPVQVKHVIGHELDRVQRGLNPTDWKPMPAVGKSVREIRVHECGQYRVIYLTKYANIIYVLHAFRKKTQKTRQRDIKLARTAARKLLLRSKP